MHLFTTNGDVVARQIGDQTVIVPVRGEAARLEAVFALDEAGAFLWESLTKLGSASVEQLAAPLVESFEVDLPTATRDVGDWLDEMVQCGLVERLEADGSRNS